MIKFLRQKNRGFTRTLTFKSGKKLVSGFTLVETLVAIAIFTVSILAVMAVLANSISDTNYAKKKITAAYLAQEGIEYVRKMRDTFVLTNNQTGWADFIANDIPYLATDPNFDRLITKVLESPDEVKITSKVKWTQGSGTYDITFSENLYNWVE